MIPKHWKEWVMFLALGPLFPAPAAALTSITTGNAYMVENTTGTSPSGSACYEFQTRPTCGGFINGLVISSGALAPGNTNYIQNRDTLQAGATYFVSSGTVTNLNVTNILTPVTFQSTVVAASTMTLGGALQLSATAGTAGQVVASNGPGTNPTWQSLATSHLLQAPVFASITTSSFTASTSFINTTLAASITPTSAASKIIILVSGVLSADSTSVSLMAFASLDRAGTNIGGANGICGASALVTSASVDNDFPCSMVFQDSPATTSAITYTVTIRASNASLTARWLRQNTTGTMILLEVQ